MKRYATVALLVFALGVIAVRVGLVARHRAAAQDYNDATGRSTLTVAPKALTVEAGKAASAKVTVSLSAGTTWGTTLHATDVPPGVIISFDPASGDPTFITTMTAKASSEAKPGVYTVKLQATGDDPSPATSYRVTVARASPGY
jgi:hypothetical protein